MNFEEFENLARLYVVGALEDEELESFAEARTEFGQVAEKTLQECQKLNSVFALSLRPRSPKPETKAALLARLRSKIDGCATRRAD